MNSPLDIRTLYIVLSQVFVMLAIAQILVWHIHREMPGPAQWASSSIFYTFGFILLVMRERIPDVISIDGGNALLMLATMLLLDGVYRFCHRSPLSVWEIWIFAGTMSLFVFFHHISPSFRFRVILVSIFLGTYLGRTAYSIFAHTEKEARSQSILAGITLGVLSTILLLRSLLFLVRAPSSTLFTDSTFSSILMVSVILTSIGWTLGLILMLTQRVATNFVEVEAMLRHLIATDSLTGIGNRRSFFQAAQSEFARARRYHTSVSLIQLDLDYFKQINDTYGHAAGDQVLRKAATICQNQIRTVDTLGRIGGEEFAIILPETECASAYQLAERIRHVLAETIILFDNKELHVTASFGVAMLQPEDPDLDTALQRADKALYAAKNKGRNRVEMAPSPATKRTHSSTI